MFKDSEPQGIAIEPEEMKIYITDLKSKAILIKTPDVEEYERIDNYDGEPFKGPNAIVLSELSGKQ